MYEAIKWFSDVICVIARIQVQTSGYQQMDDNIGQTINRKSNDFTDNQ